MPRIPRPRAGDFDPYFDRYLAHVPDGDVVAMLQAQHDELRALLGGLSDAQAAYRYAPGKWSVKQVLGHVIDVERVFSYRALSIARGHDGPLPGFDQDAFVAQGGFDGRSMASLLEEHGAVRTASLTLFRSLPAEFWERRGTADRKPVAARAIPFMLAGHERHHLAILRERYLEA